MDAERQGNIAQVMRPVFTHRPQQRGSANHVYQCFKKPPERRSLQEIMAVIKSTENSLFFQDFFAKLQFRQMPQLYHVIRYEYYPPNQVIYQTQQQANKFFIVLDGQVRAYLPNSHLFTNSQYQPKESIAEDDIFVKTYGKGDYFGDPELFYNTPRVATAISCEQGAHLGYIISQ